MTHDDDRPGGTSGQQIDRLWSPGRIVAIFIGVSIVWILGTDWILAVAVSDSEFRDVLQTAKGMTYIALLAALLYVLMQRARTEQQKLHSAIRAQQSLLRTRVEEKTAELKVSQDRLRLLVRRLDSLRETERKDLSRDLHDQLGSELTQLKLDLVILRDNAFAADDKTGQTIDSALQLVESLYSALRDLSRRLRPAVLDDFGLAAGIEWLAEDFRRNTGRDCDCDVEVDDLPADEGRDVALFRICQESLTNVIKHADASAVWIRLFTDPRGIVLIVADDGCGPGRSAREFSGQMGIIGMQERALTLGGTVSVTSRDGGGTLVKATVPIRAWPGRSPVP